MIERIEVVRNNEIVHSRDVNIEKFEEVWKDPIKFDLISLLHSNKREKFLFYYLRVFLETDNMAWTSPIWITEKFNTEQ